MNFLEFLVVIIFIVIIYFLLKPIQQRLEWKLFKFFRKNSKAKKDTVVDITDFNKKE